MIRSSRLLRRGSLRHAVRSVPSMSVATRLARRSRFPGCKGVPPTTIDGEGAMGEPVGRAIVRMHRLLVIGDRHVARARVTTHDDVRCRAYGVAHAEAVPEARTA